MPGECGHVVPKRRATALSTAAPPPRQNYRVEDAGEQKLLGAYEREMHDELASLSNACALGRDRSPVLDDEVAHHGETEAETGRDVSRFAHATREHFEDAWQEFRGDADARVAHPQDRLVVFRIDRQIDR